MLFKLLHDATTQPLGLTPVPPPGPPFGIWEPLRPQTPKHINMHWHSTQTPRSIPPRPSALTEVKLCSALPSISSSSSSPTYIPTEPDPSPSSKATYTWQTRRQKKKKLAFSALALPATSAENSRRERLLSYPTLSA